jgi:hypothetical protein
VAVEGEGDARDQLQQLQPLNTPQGRPRGHIRVPFFTEDYKDLASRAQAPHCRASRPTPRDSAWSIDVGSLATVFKGNIIGIEEFGGRTQ